MTKVYSLKLSSEDLLWFWQQKTGQKTNLCCEKFCTNSNIEGTIVHCHNENKNYIIPLCQEHKNSDKEMEIPPHFSLVEYK
ncbi:MAG: hypothetical protein HYU67_00715 [Flavobacteriia bacterium]|nr:hypothetical protein [Flavobacteriia bacterium]